MGRIFVSLVVFFIVMGGVLVYQATRGTSSLVLMPSELLSKAHASTLPRIRVGGRVVDPIEYQTEPVFLLRFSVRDPIGGEQVVSAPQSMSLRCPVLHKIQRRRVIHRLTNTDSMQGVVRG